MKLTHKLDNNQKQEILKKYIDGESAKILAEQYNVTLNTICYVIKKLGGKIRSKKIILQKDEFEELVNLYMLGAPAYKLAEKFNLSDITIVKILKENNIKIRTLSESIRSYKRNEFYFDRIDTEEKAYFLGLLYADGCNNKNNTVELALQEIDKYMVERFAKALDYSGPIYKRELNKKKKEWQNSFRVSINSKLLSNSLINLGMFHKKSMILKFPTFDQVPEYLMRHFIRGYIDGDGCICISTKNYKYKNKITQYLVCSLSLVGTEQFCSSVANFIFNKINIKFPKASKHANIFEIRISDRSNIKVILDWLYKDATIYLGRKYKKYQDILKLCNKSLNNTSYTKQ